MYRNTNDKRVIKSADRLYQAIGELLETRKFEEIGIKEVSEQAGVGRATFYRNFDYVSDVLALKLDQEFLSLKAKSKNVDMKPPGNIAHFFNFWVSHPEVLEVLLKANQWQLFTNRFTQSASPHLLEASELMNFNKQQQQYLQATISSMFSTTLQTWIFRGKIESADALMDMFSLPFKIYLERHIYNKF